MATTPLLPQSNRAAGTYQSPALATATLAALTEVAAILDDARLTAPGLRLRLTAEDSADGGKTWRLVSEAVWDSGPDQRPRVAGGTLPRPGSGVTSPRPGSTHIRGRIAVTLADGSTGVALGASLNDQPRA